MKRNSSVFPDLRYQMKSKTKAWGEKHNILRQIGAIMILGVIFYAQIGLLFIFDKSAFSIKQTQNSIITKQVDSGRITGSDVRNKKRTYTNDILKNKTTEMYREDINKNTKNETDQVIKDVIEDVMSVAVMGDSKGINGILD